MDVKILKASCCVVLPSKLIEKQISNINNIPHEVGDLSFYRIPVPNIRVSKIMMVHLADPKCILL